MPRPKGTRNRWQGRLGIVAATKVPKNGRWAPQQPHLLPIPSVNILSCASL